MSPINNQNATVSDIEMQQISRSLRTEELLETPIIPSQAVWERIEATIDEDITKERNLKKRSSQNRNKSFNWGACAAAVTVAVSCWVGWSNYQLQMQFASLLEQNQYLEQQLSKPGFTSYSEANLMQDLDGIELQLLQASTKEERLALLKQRRKNIEKLIDIQKGKPQEFYL
ncbi:MAG: hypothetical protein ACPGR2_11180 [Psychrobium sp.]